MRANVKANEILCLSHELWQLADEQFEVEWNFWVDENEIFMNSCNKNDTLP
jgi:hypothetical protein